MTQEQAEKLLAGEIGFLLDSGEPLFIELYSKIKGKGLWPKTIVCYDREAFLYAPGNVRITSGPETSAPPLEIVDFLNAEIFLSARSGTRHCAGSQIRCVFAGACPYGGAGTRKAGGGLLQIRPVPAVRLKII